MNKIKCLENMGFKIPWKLIEIGLFGADEIPVVLSHDDVWDYLYDLLTDSNDQTEKVIALICERSTPEDWEDFDELIKEYSSDEQSDEIIQKRKWRAYLLKSLTDTANEDSLQGMLALMEFWNAMGMPTTCPFAFPASADRKCLSKYFSKSSYKKCLENNKKWLGEEITEIVLSETS